ncbi:MAG TPA: ABC transporter permease [Alphaproteobacteria bacterium]|nr:ABC transporter permease [Alphaproteobacteria bacterium]
MTDFSNVKARPWYLSPHVNSQALYVFVVLVVLIVAISSMSGAFLTSGNLLNISKNFAFIGIASLGVTLVIITGGIDLSVGSVMALTAIVTGLLFQATAEWPTAAVPGLTMALCLAAGLAVAGLVGLINGWLIARVGLSPFVTTLGTLSICRGLGYVLTQGRGTVITGPDTSLFYAITDGRLLGLPTPLAFMLILAVGMGVFLHHTAWGRYTFAIGGNERAADLTGVPVERVKISIYVAASLMAGFAGILMAGWLGSVPANLAFGYELRIIAASVIGGANLSGGAGGPIGAIIGAALIEVIRNGLVLMRVSAYWQDTLVGLIIILAVLVDRLRARRAS